jgi:hypothetical protein
MRARRILKYAPKTFKAAIHFARRKSGAQSDVLTG